MQRFNITLWREECLLQSRNQPYIHSSSISGPRYKTTLYPKKGFLFSISPFFLPPHALLFAAGMWDFIYRLLLLSRFSRVQLCATPQTAAHQPPPSLGFSRQEHWSGLPFPSPTHASEKWKWRCSVVSDSSQPHGLQPTRLLCPWDFPGKSTRVGCHCLLREIFSDWH